MHWELWGFLKHSGELSSEISWRIIKTSGGSLESFEKSWTSLGNPSGSVNIIENLCNRRNYVRNCWFIWKSWRFLCIFDAALRTLRGLLDYFNIVVFLKLSLRIPENSLRILAEPWDVLRALQIVKSLRSLEILWGPWEFWRIFRNSSGPARICKNTQDSFGNP